MDDQGDLFGVGPIPGVPENVVWLFEELALQIASKGWPRYSARAILHRIRWHYHIEKGNREFKCNNNWTPRMARWFMERHPQLGEFFETREQRDDGWDDSPDPPSTPPDPPPPPPNPFEGDSAWQTMWRNHYLQK
jgi:hypothetical protein